MRGDDPNRAGRTENQQCLARGDPELLQDAHGAFCRRRQSGSITPADVGRLRRPRRDEGILTVAPETELETGDFIAFLYARDRRPERVDDTSHLEPENCVGWQPEHGPEVAAADLRIGRTYPGGLDSKAYLAGAWLRHRCVAPHEDIWGSVLGQDNGFWHGRRSSTYIWVLLTVTVTEPARLEREAQPRPLALV